jgi:hypothetical protein
MRFLASLPLAAPLIAFAQEKTAEVPVEHASKATVLVFLLFFFGSIGAYVAYLWWRRKDAKAPRDE